MPDETLEEHSIKEIKRYMDFLIAEKSEPQKESRTGLYLIGIGILIVLCIIALSFFVPQTPQAEEQPTCDLNSTNTKIDLLNGLLHVLDGNTVFTALSNEIFGDHQRIVDQDTNQHSQLAQLIIQSNYLMQCTIDTNSATTIEVPQADNSYRRYTKFSAVYCPQGGG